MTEKELIFNDVITIREMCTLSLYDFMYKRGFKFKIENSYLITVFDGEDVELFEALNLEEIDYSEKLIELIFPAII